MQVIVDGSHVANRARRGGVGFKERTDGIRIGTIWGFLKSLSYSTRSLNMCSNQTIVVWDGGRSLYRKQLYPGYKVHEKGPSEKLEDIVYWDQINHLQRKFLPALGIRSINVKGTEADDVISVLAHEWMKYKSGQVIIVSGDTDFHQLLKNEYIAQFLPDGQIFRKEDVIERWGTTGIGVAMAKSIIGDASEKIKGIQGIGKKRALNLVPYYKTILDRIANTGTQRTKEIESDDKSHRKYLDKITENIDTIDRNMKLIALPETYYTPYFSEPAMTNELIDVTLSSECKRDLPKFVSLCKEWELDDLMHEVASSL